VNSRKDFSERIELPKIPEGPGVCIIENERGNVLQIAFSRNIQRRIGELLDSEGQICVHGPKIYKAQQRGERLFVRWKLTPDCTSEKRDLIQELKSQWG